ncbi:cytochrome c oxidase subunit II [Nocardioides sp. Kera G14]|uniref:aa3-type cytochrome oxidase subunit II n=1 Tax=Nocardioides sp. Kera G14 TaxID=2884264 RepID=UPI001D12BA92|nr:cytochrome c oxidase subunit II [Nocardioides sp. Kera G14]UDY22549.1 cytochrome c oxidase subunit II [Nocardioides sp. Kera G14]
MPETVTVQGKHNLDLWQGAWIAALITGGITWALIFYAIWRFRRRSDADIPVQTRYNLPLEIFYTIAPVLMCIVFFTHTVKAENALLDDSNATNTIEVVGQQWQWTFNYGLGERDASADDFDAVQKSFPYSDYVYEVGTASYIPTIYLPVNVTTRFNLHSPDVIHDFGVPSFHMRMDVVPGRVNHYAVTPTKTGTYKGKCYELCGVSHSRMLFNVKVVSQADYDAYLAKLKEQGAERSTPLLGGSEAYTQDGLNGDSE